MKLLIDNPTKAILENPSQEDLAKLVDQLSYRNTANQHLLKRHYNNHWGRSNDPEGWKKKLEDLKRSINHTLVFENYIRPGSIPYLVNLNFEVENKISYPIPKPVAWVRNFPFTLHPYQEESWEKLLAVKHGNIELCTGSGKSAILLKICRESGFRTAIIAPSKSIFLELVQKFEFHFGKGAIGKFGANKKQLDKRFTICIGDSLVNVKPNTKEWEFFSNLDMLCVDESHTWGAETLEQICHGILSNVPYRIFLSGTQTRGDGAERLLQSIIGKTVHTLTTKEAVEKGYIAPHLYKIINLESSNPNFVSQDQIEMKREHFLRNSNICAFIAKLANADATTRRRQTLVLVEELSQIASLLPLLKVPTTYAHSEANIKKLLPLGLEKVKSEKSVEMFNKGEAMVLIGTSCIATGTNIFPTHNTINWVGGASEIKTKQGAVGRSVRLHSQNPYKNNNAIKTSSVIWDFNIYDVPEMERQLGKRVGYYSESESEIKYINIKK